MAPNSPEAMQTQTSLQRHETQHPIKEIEVVSDSESDYTHGCLLVPSSVFSSIKWDYLINSCLMVFCFKNIASIKCLKPGLGT